MSKSLKNIEFGKESERIIVVDTSLHPLIKLEMEGRNLAKIT